MVRYRSVLAATLALSASCSFMSRMTRDSPMDDAREHPEFSEALRYAFLRHLADYTPERYQETREQYMKRMNESLERHIAMIRDDIILSPEQKDRIINDARKYWEAVTRDASTSLGIQTHCEGGNYQHCIGGEGVTGETFCTDNPDGEVTSISLTWLSDGGERDSFCPPEIYSKRRGEGCAAPRRVWECAQRTFDTEVLRRYLEDKPDMSRFAGLPVCFASSRQGTPQDLEVSDSERNDTLNPLPDETSE